MPAAGLLLAAWLLAGALGLKISSVTLQTRDPLEWDEREKFAPISWDQAREMASSTMSWIDVQEKLQLLRKIPHKSFMQGWYDSNVLAIRRFQIPFLKISDVGNLPGPVGTTTMWPSGLALAATWDERVVYSVGRAMGMEFVAKGANVLLGPSVNVHRAARSGRNFEHLSGEDPYLGSRLVKPFVQGVQGNGIIATARHYAFYEQETDRGDGTPSNKVDPRTAWELYYPPFAAAVEAGVGAVVCADEGVNGTKACESSALLRRDLKRDMGFQGFVMSDEHFHHISSVATGLDQSTLRFSLNGEINERIRNTFHGNTSAIDEAAFRVLSAIYHSRMPEPFGEPFYVYKCSPPSCAVWQHGYAKTKRGQEIARVAATRSVTLLKNDGVLPITRENQTIAVLGRAANARASFGKNGTETSDPDYYSGGGSSHVTTHSVVTPWAGIQNCSKPKGTNVILVDSDDPAKALKAVEASDVVIIVGATTSGERQDRKTLHLDGHVDALIDAVAHVKPTIVLMQTPGAVLTPWRENVSAIANLFLAGEETGTAWAQVLFGEEPQGRLPIMMPATEHDVIEPSRHTVEYAEGLFTSYRSKTLKSAFPFGHGLSYTTFEYGKANKTAASDCHGAACVSIPIKNSGNRSGVEVVQAYLHFPPEANEPNLVLRGFARTHLEPGKNETVTFVFTERDLSIYNTSAGGWVQQSGVQVHIGRSSADIREQVQL